MECCNKTYQKDCNFCSYCGKELKKYEITDLLNSKIELPNHAHYLEIKHPFGCSYVGNFQNNTNVNDLLSHWCHYICKKKYEIIDTEFVICYMGNSGYIQKPQLSEVINQKIEELGEVTLYMNASSEKNNEKFPKLMTKDGVLQKYGPECYLYEMENIFDKELKYKNVTIKYTSNEVAKGIKPFYWLRQLRKHKKEGINSTEEMMILFGVTEIPTISKETCLRS